MTMSTRLLLTACAALAAPTEVVGFAGSPLAAAAKASPLAMSPSSPEASRRDVLAGVSSAAFGLATLVASPDGASAKALDLRPGPITEASAANIKAYEASYQGVYNDPNHPEGYRIIMANGKGGATMTLSDGNGGETYKNIPVGVKDGELSFDFGFKGGPKGVAGVLSDDRKFITFPDGNTWTKNKDEYDGIYKDPKYPNGYRIVRKFKGTKTITEVNDTGNPKDSVFVTGDHASLVSIPTAGFNFYNFPGIEKAKKEKATNVLSYALQAGDGMGEHADETVYVGQFSLQDKNTAFPFGTITFSDKTVWTRI